VCAWAPVAPSPHTHGLTCAGGARAATQARALRLLRRERRKAVQLVQRHGYVPGGDCSWARAAAVQGADADSCRAQARCGSASTYSAPWIAGASRARSATARRGPRPFCSSCCHGLSPLRPPRRPHCGCAGRREVLALQRHRVPRGLARTRLPDLGRAAALQTAGRYGGNSSASLLRVWVGMAGAPAAPWGLLCL